MGQGCCLQLCPNFIEIWRLEVIQQDTRPAVEFFQLLCQGAWRQVEADIGNGLKPVWKRAFGDDRPQVFGTVGPLPKFLSGSRVGGEGQRRAPLSNQQAYRRHDMIDGNWSDFNVAPSEASDGEGFPCGDFDETDRGVEVVGYSAEIRPGIVIEEVAFDVGQNPAGRIDGHRLVVEAENILNQEGKGRRVITMSVGDDHVPNSALLVNFEGPRDRSGIDRYGVIDQKGRHSTRRVVTAKTPKDFKFHRTSITRKTNE